MKTATPPASLTRGFDPERPFAELRRFPFCSILSTALLAGAALLFGSISAFGQFDAANNTESVQSAGVYQIYVTDPKMLALLNVGVGANAAQTLQYGGWDPTAQTLTSPLMYDPSTQIGVSKAHQRESAGPNQLYFPLTVGLGTYSGVGYPHQVIDYNDYVYPVPAPFDFENIFAPGQGHDEELTEIQAFNLSPISTCGSNSIATPPQIPPANSLNALTLKAGSDNPLLALGTVLNSSIGMVQSDFAPVTTVPNALLDFSAHSFFNIYVEIQMPKIPGSVSEFAFNFPGGRAVLVSDPVFPLLVASDIATGPLPPSVVYTHTGNSSITPWPVDLRFRDTSPMNDPNTGQPYFNAGDSLGTIVLAGHGTGLNPCSKDAAAIAAFVSKVFGPPGQLARRATVPRIFPNAAFPSPSSIYQSALGTNFGGGSKDVAIFTNGAAHFYIRDIILANLVNPIVLPLAGNAVTYTNTNATVTCNISTDGTNFIPATAIGTNVVRIDNTNAPVGGATVYSAVLKTLNVSGSSGSGAFKLQLSPNKVSSGKHIVEPTGSGSFKIGGYFDVALQNGFGLIYKDATNRPIRIEQSVAICGAPGAALFVTKTNSLVKITWPDGTYRLQASAFLNPVAWVNITGTSPITLPPTNSYKFFRLICP